MASRRTEIQITETPSDALAKAQSELVALDKRADEMADAAVPVNTRRAYEFELACFASWCTRHGVRPMPAEPRTIRSYLLELAEKGRSPEEVPSGKAKGPMGYSSLMRALGAICRSHRKGGHLSPWKHALIEETRDALGVLKGTAPKKQKHDLGTHGEALFIQMCDQIKDDLRGVRDRAMLLVGWEGGGRRRSEITAARVEHFETIEGGIRWRIPRSKTDQTGKELVVPLTPSADKRYCPVYNFRHWLELSKIESGFVFRGVDANTDEVMTAALAPEGVARRVQHYVKLLGLDPANFGGHSLRSGFITTAHKEGRKDADIMAATGHRSRKQMDGYIRRAGLIEESAARGLIDAALERRGEKKPEEK